MVMDAPHGWHHHHTHNNQRWSCSSTGDGQEHLVHSRNIIALGLLISHSTTLMHTNDGAHGVEHVDEEEGKHHYQHIETEHLTPFKLAGCPREYHHVSWPSPDLR